MKTKVYYDLLDIIEKQSRTISKQNETISNLVLQNTEKENFINEIMKQKACDTNLIRTTGKGGCSLP